MPQSSIPTIRLGNDFRDLKVAVIGSLWNQEIVDALVDNAVKTLEEHEIPHQIYRVAGSFELIWAANQLIKQGFSAVALFGVIIRGQTPHFEYVSSAVTQGATQLSFTDSIVGFGVLTCDTYEQALDRCGLQGSKENKGKDTIEAILLSHQTLKQISFDS